MSNYDVERLKYWTDKDGNRVYGNPKKFNKSLQYLMSYNPEDVISKKGIKIREVFYPVLSKVFPLTSKNKFKVIKSYDSNGKRIKVPKDKKIIFVANHGFKDDIALSLMTAKYPTYTVFASIPDFFYTIDGYALNLFGTFLMDRRDKLSKASIEPKIDYAFSLGLKRVLFFIEGVWSKSPNELLLKTWKGAYLFAKKNDALLMPITLLNKDMKIDGDLDGKKGICYSVLGEPVDPSNTSWEELEEILTSAIASKRYELFEKYSESKRDRLGYGMSYWEEYVRELINAANKVKDCSVVMKNGETIIKDVLAYDYEVENNHVVYDYETDSYKEVGAQYVPKKYICSITGEEKDYITEEEVFRTFNERVEFNEKTGPILIKTLQVPKKTREYFE